MQRSNDAFKQSVNWSVPDAQIGERLGQREKMGPGLRAGIAQRAYIREQEENTRATCLSEQTPGDPKP